MSVIKTKKPQTLVLPGTSALAKRRDVNLAFAKLGRMLGFRVSAEGVEIQEINDGIHISAKSNIVEYPFKIQLRKVDAVLQARVSAGMLFIDDSITTASIEDLEEWINVSVGSYVILKGLFDSWPTLSGVSIEVSSTAPNRTIFDTSVPPIQTETNTIIGRVVEQTSAVIVEQFVHTNLRMRTYIDSGVVANNPWSV